MAYLNTNDFQTTRLLFSTISFLVKLLDFDELMPIMFLWLQLMLGKIEGFKWANKNYCCLS